MFSAIGRDINDTLNYSRLMTALHFMGIIAFMFGSIKQIKKIMKFYYWLVKAIP